MSNAYRGDPGIVHHAPDYAGALDETAQNIKESLGFPDEANRR